MASVSAIFDSHSSRQPNREPPRLRVSTWHYDTIIDFLLASPGATYGQIAAHIGRGQIWVSMVMRSDAFQAHYASRRVVVNEAIRDSVADKIAEVAIASADLTLKHMRDNPAGIGFTQRVDTLVQASKALGFGLAPPAPAVMVNNNAAGSVMIASREQIDRARERLRSLQADSERSMTSSITSGPQRTAIPMDRAESAVAGGAVVSADSSYDSVDRSRPSEAPPVFEFEEATIVGGDQ